MMKLDRAKEILTGITNNPKSCLYSQRTAIQTVLDALDKAGTLPKIPIDYSKDGSGEAPFDGKDYLLHGVDDGNDYMVKAKYVAAWSTEEEECYFEDVFGNIYDRDVFTHYTPMPQFEEVKGGEV